MDDLLTSKGQKLQPQNMLKLSFSKHVSSEEPWSSCTDYWLPHFSYLQSSFLMPQTTLHFYPTLCNPMDCSLPGSSIHGIVQAIVLEWGAISFSRRSFRPRDRTRISRIVDRCFTIWATRVVLYPINISKLSLGRWIWDVSSHLLAWLPHGKIFPCCNP